MKQRVVSENRAKGKRMEKKKRILTAACAVGVMTNGGMILSPAMASIIEYFSEVPEMLSQMLITVPALMMVPSSVVSSYINKKYSRRQIFAVCLSMLTLAGIFPYLFPYFPLIFLSRIVVGVAIGAMIPLANSMIVNTFEGREKDQAMGIFTAVGSLSGAAMVYSGGIIVQYGWRNNFLTYLLALAELAVVLMFCPAQDETYPRGKEIQGKKTNVLNKTVLYIWIVFFVYMGFLNTFPPNIALFIQGEGIGTSTLCGIVSAIFLISGFVSGLVYSGITKLFGRFTLVFGLAATAAGIVIVSGSHHAAAVIAGSCIAGFGMGVTLPTGNLTAAASVDPSDSAAAIAIGSSGYQLAQFMTTFMVTPLAAVIFGEGVVRGRFRISAIVLCIWTAAVLAVTAAKGRKERTGKEERQE